MLRFTTTLFVAVMMFLSASKAFAEKRVALVIGNSAYKYTAILPNPKNDAEVIVKALKSFGFDVIPGLNLTHEQMVSAIREFARKLRGADVGLLFYAGHGLQVNGRNYLVPTDAQLVDEADLEFSMVELGDIMRQMERATKTNLIFLDACRDNPLARNLARAMGASRSTAIGQGLAEVRTGIGTMITFATQPDNVALDGTGANSPFTTALIKHIGTPGLDISPMLRAVRRDVIAATNSRQVPWNHSSLTDSFVFKPGATPLPKPGATTQSGDRDVAFWNAIRWSNDPEDFADYLAEYPNGTFVRLAKRRLSKLKKAQAAKLAAKTPAKPAKPLKLPENLTTKFPLLGTPKTKPAIANNKTAAKKPAAPTIGLLGSGKTAKPAKLSFEPKMVRYQGGKFFMGCVSKKNCEKDENPVRYVTVGPFELGKYEITFREWDACAAAGGCKGWKKDEGWGRGTRPVINVSYDEITTQYIPWLNRTTGKQYRLPTEAEWEYAARAAGKDTYHFGADVTKLCLYANHADKKSSRKDRNDKCDDGFADRTAPAGSFKPNAYGMYDMYGNVWEYVQDCYHKDYNGLPKDASAWLSANSGNCKLRILRGGGWSNAPRALRSANRGRQSTDKQTNFTGFRIARTLPRTDKTTRLKLPEPFGLFPYKAILTKTSKLQKTPSVTSASLGSLQIGEAVTVLGKAPSGFWFKAKNKMGVVGYIWKSNVKKLN